MKVILVDDERLALEYLERQLLKFDNIEIVGLFSDPLVAREEILRKDVDAVFLDISLPEINGIELADQLLGFKPQLNIVFVTAYNEYAIKAFELNAIDYIVKPTRAERLTKTVDRIRKLQHSIVEDEAVEEDHDLRLHLLKQVSVELPKGQFTLLQWRTSKAQELFLFLLQHRGQLVRKSVLIDLLWPEYESDKVYSQLYTAVYHIRKTLQPYGERFQISNTTEGYILNMNNVILDIVEWEDKLTQLPRINEEFIDEYVETMKLYTGDYLQEFDYWWTESERQRLKGMWLFTSYSIADWYQQQQLIDQAIICYVNICNQYPLEEEAHFSLMKMYASMDRHSMVERQFNLLLNSLQEEVSVSPSNHISEWYELWAKKTTMQN
ncbi:Two-component response regulator, SAPR family, consists of REC, wHTH and BTAD domains [Fontibacillus panacisegetis]|uniref:Two-component response regulator, SAPR family, consists of REC, wHTH and BTAD domains n=1 Tax=Fontibacillus panacisegetis TaxID=670482 RepID=A0A1G7NXD7_9BACL|nr:response regulator [Fontibacillus panacisegetis]SDF78695.1 Two-component response regulator, SAPR family, consists of REC, wHTH and BTAD domains [Fontibacillus panacisegetis]